MKLSVVAVLVFLLNLPFGYWRAGARRFSWRWIVAVHAPVPGIVALRLASGLGFQLITFPVLIAAFFLGQKCGALLKRATPSSEPSPR